MTDQICDRWEDYYDGEMLPAEQQEFETHLPQCPACILLLQHTASLDSDLLEVRALGQEFPTPANVARSRINGENPNPESIGSKRFAVTSALEKSSSIRSRRFAQRLVATVAVLAGTVLLSLTIFALLREPTNSLASREQAEQPQIASPELAENAGSLPEKFVSPIQASLVKFESSKPTIVGKQVTTPNFTYITVYPQVERVDPQSDQHVQPEYDQLNATF